MASDRDTSRDVAIIGMACRFAKSRNADELWDNLVARRDCFERIPANRWNLDHFHTDRFREHDKTYVSRAAFIDDVRTFPTMHFRIAPRRVEAMDPQHRLALETTREALLDAGVERSEADLEEMGTFLGVSTPEYRNLVTSRTVAMMMSGGEMGSDEGVGEALSEAVKNVAPISAFSIPGNLLNMAAANVASQWGLGGPAYTIDAACASSLLAVHDAVTHIRAGICKTAVAGGVYVNVTPETIVGFSRIGAISQKGECRPFDEDADGFLEGDGCGIVILKSYDEAVRDGDRIYATICGSGVNNDAGRSSGPMAPSLAGQKAAVRRAYRDAGVDPRTVQFVSCHGTATPVGDPVEVTALRDIFEESGELDHPVYLGSIKGNVGHTMSAAGVAGLVHAILALHHRKITPQAGFEHPHPELPIQDGTFLVPTDPVDWQGNGAPRRAAVSSFGFGGTNCHLVLEEAPTAARTPAVSKGPETVVLAAETRELLAEYAESVADAVARNGHQLSDVAYTLSATRKLDKVRLAIVADDGDELVEELRRAASLLRSEEPPGLALGPNAFWSDESSDVGFMFPGQGAQRLGLFRELYDRYPGFASHLDRLSDSLADALGGPVTDFLYCDPTESAEERLKQTEICQPVMATIGLALARFLEDLGVAPSVCLGHSLGEFVAAASGGMLSDADAVRFVAERGRLMADLDLEDTGSMIAVMASAEDVEPHLVEGARIANVNHPRQTVVSGTTAAIDTVAGSLTDADVKVTHLRVSHAFHSEVVAPVEPALAELVENLDLAEPRVDVISAISGRAYDAPDDARRTFVEHTTSTVDFMTALREAAELADVLVEVGAGTTLTSFAQGTLGDRLRAAPTLGAKTDDDGRPFQRTLATLSACGVEVDFAKLHPARRVVSLPPAPLRRTTHWVVRDKEIPLDVPASSKKGESVTTDAKPDTKTDSPSDELVALFREQNEILRQHASIIAAQNAVLGGEAPAVDVATLPAGDSGAPQERTGGVPKAGDGAQRTERTESAEETSAARESAGVDYESLVFEAVAGVSAFPTDALSADQELATELGFDSLMFVDLGADLQKRVDGLAIPQDAFDQSTTIADVVSFLESAAPGGEAGDARTAPGETEDLPLRRWTLEWEGIGDADVESALFAPDGLLVVTTSGVDEDAILLAETLQARGVDARILDLDAESELPAGTTSVIDFSLRGAAWNVEHLVARRRLADQLWHTSDETPRAFVTVTSGDTEPTMYGAARGFAKALAREWPDARVASIDVHDAAIVAIVLRELDNPLHHAAVRWTSDGRLVQLAVESSADVDGGVPLTKDDVVVVTGGAKGIGLECTRALAAETDATLVLVGRSDEADVEETLGELREKTEVHYVSWDVTEERADAFADLPTPTAVVHAAGVIRDAKVHEKSDDDVRLVAGVKVDGLRNVLDAAGDDVKLVVGFGSWAGRFGNAHQTDYSAANDAVSEWLTDLASDEVRAVNVDWPLWEGSEMVSSIPAKLRDAMRQRGVTFIAPDEGSAAFLSELGRADGGEVIYGRTMTRREAPYRATVKASVDTLPYVADHLVRGIPIVPFAGALDWLAGAAARAGDVAGAIVLRDVQVFRGLDISTPSDIEIRGDMERGRGTVELRLDGTLAYRASAATEPGYEISALELDGEPVGSSLGLETFYEKHAFHGPRIQGIARVEAIAPNWVVGYVKTSTPAQLLDSDTGRRWTVDPLAVDGAMQLVLYHLQTLHGIGAIPVSLDEWVQVRPFGDDEVKCTMVLDEMADGVIVGTVTFEGDDGIIAKMSGLRAKEFREADEDQEAADIDPKFWDIGEFPEVKELEQRLQMAELIGIRNPYFWAHDGPARNTAIIDGQEMINYSSYNYCGFSGREEVTKAAQDAAERYGTSVSASRVASGQIPLHQELEDAIAGFVGTEASLVFSAGHMTNETCIGHLFDKNDLIIHDSLAHNSILTGAELSGAKRMQFPHSDWEALDQTLSKLRGNFEKVGIFIEGVYSMDGDIPDLPKFIDIKRKHRCLLYVDEAHSMGVIGPRGAGISDYFGVDPSTVDVWMGTLSKSFASCGGYITGSRKLIEYLKYTAPAFVFSAGISPANAGAALAAVRLLADHPEIPRTLQERAEFFLNACIEQGLDTGMSKDSAVVPVIVGNSIDCLKLSQRLAERGINVQPIVYPAVEDESSRLRFFLSAVHTEEELRTTAEIVAEELADVRSGAAAE